MSIERIHFRDLEERDLIRNQYEQNGYGKILEHTNADKSGYFDFQLKHPAVIDKTDMIADGVDLATISDIPVGSIIALEDMNKYEVYLNEYNVNDGVFEFTLDTPGVYKIACIHPDYLTKRFFVNAS